MNRKDLIFISILAGVLGVFIFLSVIKDDAPQMTGREEHRALTRNTPPDSCMSCHDPNSTIAPMNKKVKHPKKGLPPKNDNCFLCHKPPATAVTALNWLWLKE